MHYKVKQPSNGIGQQYQYPAAYRQCCEYSKNKKQDY